MDVQNKGFGGEELLVMTKSICGVKNECFRWVGRSDLRNLENEVPEKPEN